MKRLPPEIAEEILQYLPAVVHAKVLGLTPRSRKRLLHKNKLMDYLALTPVNYHLPDDKHLLAHFENPLTPYMALLCLEKSCEFFNKCIPKHVRVAALNWPSPNNLKFLCSHFEWFALIQKLLKHEHEQGRVISPNTVRVSDVKHVNELNSLSNIIDINVDDVHRCPYVEIDVYLDDNIITLCSYYTCSMYRIIK
ncbi:LEF-7 [Epiphyas postvittana nucleopolyhedrovirus]|uniref:LEF-7 n=1 Tax=Epiphyas postvittana nucleopolyhedrovirus TaxID=70600 RepID=Q91GE5_NPVEP|nr:LEF-7 [Epiphyas postvittana nucleopolyhedrovirus]AAK85673.1 LEF-7 [Epiphyas postvittana nucleopolyhedrovirus]